jgi:hypothetical protein
MAKLIGGKKFSDKQRIVRKRRLPAGVREIHPRNTRLVKD